MICKGCRVAGCTRCNSSKDDCATCSFGLRTTADGTKCVLMGLPVFYMILAVIVGIVSVIVCYLISLFNRKAVNNQVLAEALEDRELSKLRDESVPGMPLYPLSTQLTQEPISGRGVLLFFRHMLAALVWAFLVTVAMAILVSYYGLEEPTMGNLCGEDDAAQEATKHEAEQAMFWFVFLVYVGSTLGSLVLVVSQRTAFRALDSGTTAMQDFALIAKGFPREGGDGMSPWEMRPPEQEYREFFEGALGLRIVGVSVSWHYNKEREAVDKAIAKELALLEWGEGFADSLKEEKRRPCFASFDHFLCGIGGDESDEEESDSEEESWGLHGPSMGAASARLAGKFETSGYAVVVFHTKEDAQHALSSFGSGGQIEPRGEAGNGHFGSSSSSSTHLQKVGSADGGPPQLSSPTFVPRGRMSRWRFRGQHEIRLKRLPCGPGEICWENYGKHWMSVCKDIIMGISKVVLFVVFWCVLFYGPYAFFIVFSTKAAGAATALAGGVQGTLLGIVISIGNQTLYGVIRAASDRAGFHYATQADCYNMIMYCAAVFINTLLDLWTVFLLADGERLDASFKERSVDLANLGRIPSMEEALSTELFSYLCPGTLLGPFMVEPVIYFLSMEVTCLIIRTRSGIGPKHAQDLLALDRFDFTRYADNVINIMLVQIFLFFTSSRTFFAFIALVASIVYVFVWDSYRVLRSTHEHEMDLDTTESTAQFLLVMPCGLLAGCAVFRARKMNWLGPDMSWKCAILVGLFHCLVHAGLIGLVQSIVPNSSDEDECADETYRDLAGEQALSWFNSNPLQCLRSKYILGENPPCIFCAKGKEKLLRVNKAAGCFFDGPALSRTIDKAAILKDQDFVDVPTRVKEEPPADAPAQHRNSRRGASARQVPVSSRRLRASD